MTENEKMEQHIHNSVQTGNMPALIGIALRQLVRIANAQEELVALAKADMEIVIDQEAESRATILANEAVEASAKRSFIGKKP